MANELVTCREIADILMGNPQAVDVVVQDLTGKGVKILRDWADRPAVTLADAKRVVGADLKRQREAHEAYLRDREVDMLVHNAQKDRDEMLAVVFSEEMSKRQGSAQDMEDSIRIARKRVVEAESELPREVRRRLYWNTSIEHRFGRP